MANPIIHGISQIEQDSLYNKLNIYNQGRASFKEVGAYLVVLPRPEYPHYSLWIYSSLRERQAIFFISKLSTDIYETLQMASTLCFYSPRRLLLMDYNAKYMQSKGDDIIPTGKYRGHFLHEILMTDSAYLAWLAFKFDPKIPKQERFVEIARIYHSVSLDFLKQQITQHAASRFLGKEGEKVQNLKLTVTGVRMEDDPYKTQVKGTTPYFYVNQVLRLQDPSGKLISLRVSARTASRESCQLPAAEHPYRIGETVYISSARIANTYTIGNNKCTRLTHVKFGQAQ